MPRRFRHWYRTPGKLFRLVLPRRIRRKLLIPLGIILIGTFAYPLIEGPKWTLFDGLYMTVITITTLGYGEIPEPLSKPGRAFTMCLALGGIFVLFYIATDIIRSVVTGELRELLGKEHMDEQLKKLDGHTVVCGFGRMGKFVCEELERMKQRFVVIDTAAPVGEWSYRHGLRLQGDATEDSLLRHAGIERAKAMITVVGSDASNLYITLSARLLNPKITVVARAEEMEAEAKLRKVGATKVISPHLEGGHRAVQAVFKPTVHHFMEQVTRSTRIDLEMAELSVQAGSELAGQKLSETRLTRDFCIIVVGILSPSGEILTAPTGEVTIETGSTLIAIGKQKQLADAAALLLGKVG